MEPQPSVSIVQVVAAYAGIGIGAACIVAAIMVWWRHQKFAFGGAVLCVTGAVLIGLSVWQKVEFEAGPSKVSFKAAQNIIEKAAGDYKTSVDIANRPSATADDKRAAVAAQKRLEEIKSIYLPTYGSQVCGSYC